MAQALPSSLTLVTAWLTGVATAVTLTSAALAHGSTTLNAISTSLFVGCLYANRALDARAALTMARASGGGTAFPTTRYERASLLVSS